MDNLRAAFLSLLPHLADYAIYFAIAVVTLIGVLKCLLPLWTTRRALRRAIRKLQDEAGTVTDHPVWQENLFLGRRLRGCRLRFLQNAIQLDRRGLPCNVEDYVNDDTVTQGPGNATLAELIPSLLTSLGILGTFMGMTQGLSGLDVTTTDNMMTGIQNLLGGMQFAFGTSVAGVACSLIFNMLNRIAQGSSYRAIDDFTEAFTQLAMQRPLDNDVQLICQNQDRNHMLGTVSDAMTASLPQSMEKAVRSGMQPVSQAMTDFLHGATSAQIEGVSRITARFIESMNHSLSDQFVALGQTMTQINVNQSALLEHITASLHTTDAMMTDVQKLHTVSEDVMNHFEHYVSELSDARKRDEGFEQSSAALLNEMHSAADQQAQVLKKLSDAQKNIASSMQDFLTLSKEHTKEVAAEEAKTANAIKLSSQSIQEAAGRLSDSYSTYVEQVVEGVSRSMGLFEKSMTDTISALNHSGTSSELATDISQLQRTLASMEGILRDALASKSNQDT